ncbi:MAG: hypothetical protein ACOZAJ_03080 [Patescibacteria group bacterium]
MAETKILKQDLSSEYFLGNLEAHFSKRVLPFNDVDEAYWLVKNLKPFMKDKDFLNDNSDIAKRYRSLFYRCEFVCLDLLPDQEVLDLFQHHFAEFFSIYQNIDLWSRIRAILLARYILEDRDSFKQKIRKALENNQELLGQGNIFVADEQKPATISNWLLDYTGNVGTGKSESLKKAEYLTNSLNVKALSSINREHLRELINFYEKLKISSLSPEGLEDPVGTEIDGKQVTFREGNFEEIDPAIAKWLVKFKEVGLIEEDLPDSILTVAGVKPVLSDKKSSTVIKSSKPAFLFDEEDEKEADKYRSTNQESRITEEKSLEERLREYAKEVVMTNNLSFKDEINARRFELLFVSRLKEVRSGIEVKESLMKPVVSGGLGLSEVVAEKVASIIESAKKNFESPIANRQSPIAKSSSGKKEIDKLIAAELPVVLPKKPIALPLSSQFKEPVKPVVNKIQPQVKPVKDAVKEKLSDTEIDRQKVLQELARTAAAAAVSKTVSLPQDKTKPVFQPKPKPQLNDVRAPSKTLGPLDELRVLNLVDFRRLAPKPIEALRKIQGKIELIGETSIGKRIEAIRSWQSSEVYRNYLSLGRLSIEQGKPVSQIIAEQSQNGQPCLNEEEFQSIVDLNEKLRF